MGDLGAGNYDRLMKEQGGEKTSEKERRRKARLVKIRERLTTLSWEKSTLVL